jgi:hypothetical protein
MTVVNENSSNSRRRKWIMTKTDIARTMIAAWEANDLNKVASLLSDDFVLTGPAPVPLNKEAYLAFQSVHNVAFLDWKLNVSAWQENGDTVRATIGITGTQTGVFDVSKLGLPIPPVPATGKFTRWPVGEELIFTIKGDKIIAAHATTLPGGGVMGTLERLGVNVPMGH